MENSKQNAGLGTRVLIHFLRGLHRAHLPNSILAATNYLRRARQPHHCRLLEFLSRLLFLILRLPSAAVLACTRSLVLLFNAAELENFPVRIRVLGQRKRGARCRTIFRNKTPRLVPHATGVAESFRAHWACSPLRRPVCIAVHAPPTFFARFHFLRSLRWRRFTRILQREMYQVRDSAVSLGFNLAREMYRSVRVLGGGTRG